MTSGPTYKTKFRRRLEQKTDYKKRLAVLKSKKPRAIVRVSNKLVKTQIIKYSITGDNTVVAVDSRELIKLGYTGNLKNTPAVYLTALLLAKKAKKAGIKEVIFDLGNRNYKSGNKIFAALKAIVDGGLDCPHNPKAFPKIERIEGKIITDYTKKPIATEFNTIKEKIIKM